MKHIRIIKMLCIVALFSIQLSTFPALMFCVIIEGHYLGSMLLGVR